MFIPSFFARRVMRGAVAAALCALIAAGAHGAPALDFEQALRLAGERSQQPFALTAAAAAARERAVAAGQLPDPVLKLGVNNLPISGSGQFDFGREAMTSRSIGFAQSFTREDKRHARAGRYEREAEAAQAQRALVQIEVRREAAMAWFERHYLERKLALLQALRDETALQVHAAQAVYRGGGGAQSDVFGARSALAQMDNRIVQAGSERAASAVRLSRWTGEPEQRPLGASPDIASPPLAQASLDARFAAHPQLVLLQRREALAEAEADIARSERRADWSAEVMYSQRGSDYADMVSFNVSIPLQFDRANRQDRELAARLSGVDQIRAERDEAARAYLAQARAWLLGWQGNRERLRRYDETLIPLAADRVQAALAAYRGGAGSLSGVLEARSAEIDTRIGHLNVELETALLWARLRYLFADGDDTHLTTEVRP
jgi:outer membrane protein TolC